MGKYEKVVNGITVFDVEAYIKKINMEFMHYQMIQI